MPAETESLGPSCTGQLYKVNQLLNKVLKVHGGDAVAWGPRVKCSRDQSFSQDLAYDIPLPTSVSLFVKHRCVLLIYRTMWEMNRDRYNESYAGDIHLGSLQVHRTPLFKEAHPNQGAEL